MAKRKYRRKRVRKFKDEGERNKFWAGLITFNRSNHPATKFKFNTDYAGIQSQFLTPAQKHEEQLKNG